MDKKSVVNDLYQAAVVSVFTIGYSVLGKEILKMTPPSIQKFDLEGMGKLVAIVAASEMMREYLIKQKSYWNTSTSKMASIAMLIGGALANTLAYTGSSYLFSRLSKDSINKKRRRHDLVIEHLQKVRVEWAQKQQERIEFISKQRRLERKVETKFTEPNDAMREYRSLATSFCLYVENKY